MIKMTLKHELPTESGYYILSEWVNTKLRINLVKLSRHNNGYLYDDAGNPIHLLSETNLWSRIVEINSTGDILFFKDEK